MLMLLHHTGDRADPPCQCAYGHYACQSMFISSTYLIPICPSINQEAGCVGSVRHNSF